MNICTWHIYTCLYMYVHVNAFVRAHVCKCIYSTVSMHGCVYICIYVYEYMPVYICVCFLILGLCLPHQLSTDNWLTFSFGSS